MLQERRMVYIFQRNAISMMKLRKRSNAHRHTHSFAAQPLNSLSFSGHDRENGTNGTRNGTQGQGNFSDWIGWIAWLFVVRILIPNHCLETEIHWASGSLQFPEIIGFRANWRTRKDPSRHIIHYIPLNCQALIEIESLSMILFTEETGGHWTCIIWSRTKIHSGKLYYQRTGIFDI